MAKYFGQTPDQITEYKAGTVKAFRTLGRFEEYYSKVEVSDERIPNSGETYSQLMRFLKEDVLPSRLKDISWYGEPLPATVEEGLARNRYQKMDEYNSIYKRVIEPRINDIIQASKASLEMPTMKYNELGIGIFDFAKASTGLIPTYHYYSLKKKEYVEGSEVETIEKDGFKSRLKSDKSPVIVVPKIKDADDKTIYKAFKEVYDGGKLFEGLFISAVTSPGRVSGRPCGLRSAGAHTDSGTSLLPPPARLTAHRPIECARPFVAGMRRPRPGNDGPGSPQS